MAPLGFYFEKANAGRAADVADTTGFIICRGENVTAKVTTG